jgi:subtilisin
VAKTSKKLTRFIVLPTRGLKARPPHSSPTVGDALRTLHQRPGVRVVDSVHDDGAKLVEMHPDRASELRAAHPGLRIVPMAYFHPAVAPRHSVTPDKKKHKGKSGASIRIRVESSSGGGPIAGVSVVAFTDYAAKTGDQAVTGAKGHATLSLGKTKKKVERLFIYADSAHWSGMWRDIKLKSGATFQLQAIDLSFTDELKFIYGEAPLAAGAGVTVGVVDTGVAHHRDLTIAGGRNTVPGERPEEFGDNGQGHGTHVAGIIAGHGTAPHGMRGMAPAVQLRSYRVYAKGSSAAGSYAIAKAIDAAVQDQCDLINLSLGGEALDEATKSAIADARAAGSLVIVSAGNDGRKPVTFPASDPLSIAVSALGRKGTYPSDTPQAGDQMAPYAVSDSRYFVAAFSNIGDAIALTAPGVGVISTFPGDTYAVMDGTSMACPAVTGAAARLLAENKRILRMPRDSARSDAIAQLLLQSAKALGLGGPLEGRGLLR